MSGTVNQAGIEVLNDKMLKFGEGWRVYGNEPNFPHTVVANDILKIVTQIYDSNYELVGWMRHKWYSPVLTIVELKWKLREGKNERGIFKPTTIKPSLLTQKKWYDEYITIRKSV